MVLTSINKYLKWNMARWQICNYCKIYITSSHRQIGYLMGKNWTVAFSHQWQYGLRGKSLPMKIPLLVKN